MTCADHSKRMLTERLCCRPVIAADAPRLFAIYGDPATNQFNPAGPCPDIDHARTLLNKWLSHWQQHGFGMWAIAQHDDTANLLGFGGISIAGYGGVSVNNLGFRFATFAWGKGLATEFAIAAVRYGFMEIGLTTISAKVRPAHLASQKVLLNSGLHFVSTLQDVDSGPPGLCYQLSRAQWHSANR